MQLKLFVGCEWLEQWIQRYAVWVQPSGLSLSVDGRELWVADSESSTVRSMDLTTGGSRVNHLHWSQQ